MIPGLLARLCSPCQRVVRYLVFGSDVLTLPQSWLADSERLSLYESYTRQEAAGCVVQTAEQLRAETERIVAEREDRLAAYRVQQQEQADGR